MTANHYKLLSSCEDLWSGCRGHAALLQVSQLCILWILLFKMPHSHHLLGNCFQFQAKDVYPHIANLPTINQSFASRQPWCFLIFTSNFRRRSAIVSNSFRSLCFQTFTDCLPYTTHCVEKRQNWLRSILVWETLWGGRSPVAVHRLLIAVTSLVREHGL